MSTLLEEADRQFFLDLYRCAVKLYQPRIESQTKVSLGNIEVWDLQELAQHVVRDYEQESYPWIRGWFRKLLRKTYLQNVAEYHKSIYPERAKACIASYYHNAIYISFGLDIQVHEEDIARAAVHELSHALWDRLAPRPLHKNWVGPPEERQKLKLFAEGYATYAAEVWFLDMYAPCVRNRIKRHLLHDPQDIYYQGMLKIEGLVKQHGPGVLLEIPARWQEFS